MRKGYQRSRLNVRSTFVQCRAPFMRSLIAHGWECKNPATHLAGCPIHDSSVVMGATCQTQPTTSALHSACLPLSKCHSERSEEPPYFAFALTVAGYPAPQSWAGCTKPTRPSREASRTARSAPERHEVLEKGTKCLSRPKTAHLSHSKRNRDGINTPRHAL
jgi:hypothetical protein